MEKIKIIAEQTEFLLGKQTAVLGFFQEQYNSLKTLLDAEKEKAEQVKAGPELASFQNVSVLLDKQQDELVAQFEEDISFLKEQHNAIKQVMEIEDEEKRTELIDALIDKEHKIVETEQFKKDVDEEAEESKKNFSMMIEDVKATLLEEGVIGLEKLLEAHFAEQKNDVDDEEKDECCDSSCSSCNGCEGAKITSNIFEGLEEDSSEE